MQSLSKQFAAFPVTFVLLALCIGIYVLQVFLGVNPANPSNKDLVGWGANWLFFTLGGEWWRMISAVFLHVGFMHLAFNAYALFLFGQFSEKLFGFWYYLSIFLLAGVGGNLLNNAYMLLNLTAESVPAVSAGASGGIMGLGGALFVLALLKVRIGSGLLNFKALAWIMGINLAIGFAIPGIDNAAHIGGMLTGAILSAVYALDLKASRKTKQIIKPVGVATIVVAFVFVYFYLSGALSERMYELGYITG